MILNIKNRRPFITFGLGMTMLSCSVGDDVKIWQNNVCSPNEYFMYQQEIPVEIKLKYNTLTYPNTDFYVTFIQKEGLYNGRLYFESTIDDEIVNIVWSVNKWYIVFNLETTFDPIASITQDIPLPISENWGDFEPSMTLYFPRATTLVDANNQGFTFPAVESKMIQIAIINKRTGKLLPSNKIQLTVIEP